MPKKIDMVYFPRVLGSMTSDDGTSFYLHVKQEAAGEIMLGFPHSQLAALIEHAAIQAANAKDDEGRTEVTAFKASGFELGRGPDGEAVLTMLVGKQGRLNFLLPADMPGQLSETLQNLAN